MSLRRRNCKARPEEGSSRDSMISQRINSPDPVEMVRQYEQDEHLAKLLQDEFNIEMTGDVSTASISVDIPNDTIELSTSGSSIVLPQSPLDYLSGDDDDDTLPRDFGDQGDQEPGRDEELGDDKVGDSDEEDIEVDDGEDDEIDEEELEDEDEVDEEVEDDDEVDDEGEVDEEVDDEDELDEVDDEDDLDEVDDEDLDETGWVTLDGGIMDRSRLCPDEINRLPTHINSAPSSSAEGEEASKMCQICHESYAKGDELRLLPCFHKFHSSCIDPWLLSSTTCPVCRIKVDLSEGVGKF